MRHMSTPLTATSPGTAVAVRVRVAFDFGSDPDRGCPRV